MTFWTLSPSAEKLGKTAGKDALENKPTYVSILGLDKSRELAKEQYELALASVQKLKISSAEIKHSVSEKLPTLFIPGITNYV